MFLPDEIQRTLRDLGKISNQEVVKKQGDIYVAVNVTTAENRILVNETTLIESPSNKTNNHNGKITRDIPLISICLQKNINDEFIIDLINNGFYYSYDEIEYVVKQKNLKLLKILVESFKG